MQLAKEKQTTMQGVLIADGDMGFRRQMADLFIEAGYNVTITSSAASTLEGILKKTAQVVVISSELDNLTVSDLIPLLRKCNRDLTIIVVSDELSLPLTRKMRKEGIFYHALKPVKPEDKEEIRQVVQCAFRNLKEQ